MKQTYSAAFIDQALIKIYSRGNRTIQSVSEELNINHYTVKNWMRNKVKANRNAPQGTTPEKRPQDWRAEEQLLALQESYLLTGEALNAWCRERGLFAHHSPVGKRPFATLKRPLQQAFLTIVRFAVSKTKTSN